MAMRTAVAMAMRTVRMMTTSTAMAMAWLAWLGMENGMIGGEYNKGAL
jgi:hypothetical protein